MPATVICVRHAQGFHNLGIQYHSLPDPKLTPLGEKQCLALRERLGDQSKISLVTASPLSRTLHTAFVGFAPALRNGKTNGLIFAIPDAQETSDFPCDRGSDIDVLKKICQEHSWPVDLSLLKEDWNDKKIGSRYAPDAQSIQNRARDARKLIREKAKELEAAGDSDVKIVLVAHGGYLHYFTDDWEHPTKLLGTGWVNCETREYTFEREDDPEARLVETMPSRKQRGIAHPMHDREKQKGLYETAMQAWENQGLVNASKVIPEGDLIRGQDPDSKL